MILIADSGSTKCDWLFFDKTHTSATITTMGFNPFFHSSTLIRDELNKSQELNNIRHEVQFVYFFGAGCSSPERNKIIAYALHKVFPNAKTLVEHDLLGAAYATCGEKPGIACILGTGSNSCYFDGKKVYEEIPALGYILGDEGGGSVLGRKLLTRYLYKQLPKYLHEKFKNELNLTKESIFEAVYNKPNANVYMSSTVHHLAEFKKRPWVQDFVAENLKEFLEIHVCCYKNYKEVSTNFIGSIAYHFKEVLTCEASKLRINVGTIKQKPIFALKDFFFQKHYKSK